MYTIYDAILQMRANDFPQTTALHINKRIELQVYNI